MLSNESFNIWEEIIFDGDVGSYIAYELRTKCASEAPFIYKCYVGKITDNNLYIGSVFTHKAFGVILAWLSDY